MVKIISVSLTEDEKGWLEDMDISPTALIKQKISEMMTSSMSQRKRIMALEAEAASNELISQKRLKFIMDKGLTDEYNGTNKLV